jgi:hypothetical protein
LSDIAQTSIYLNTEDRRICAELQEQTGLPRSAVVRLALRRMYVGEEGEKRSRLLAIAEEIKRIA